MCSRPRVVETLEAVPAMGGPLHLAIGMFDGVHRGHQAVIHSAVQSARQTRGMAGVLTFWPHPSRIFHPENASRLISTPEIKMSLLHMAGVDWIIHQHFDREFAAIEAEEFPNFLKQKLPDLAGIYVGENFRFGHRRKGDVDFLIRKEKALGVQVVSAQRIRFNGEPISTSRIRTSLIEGEIEEANRMLGYNYFAVGEVIPGRQLGRKIGVPTLNMAWDPECRPAFGVYAVQVCEWDPENPTACGFDGSAGLAGVANYGFRPTVSDDSLPLLEVHHFGADSPWRPGSRLKVEWLKFLRRERKFDSLESLREQIERDRSDAWTFFGK